jgi:hypothetical protein
MRTRLITLAILLLVSVVCIPCARSGTETEKETIEIDGFRFTLSDPVVDFPSSIDFKIEAESESDISEITLQYQMDRLQVLPVTSVVFPAFTPGQNTSAEWEWDMTQTGGLPPGADLSYWWTVEDASGHTASTPAKTLSFDDGRHKWKDVRSTSFNLYWYEGDSDFAQQLVTAGEEALSLLGEDIGAKPERTIEVYVYASQEDLTSSLIYPQEWTGALAFTEYDILALGIGTSASDLAWGEEAMAHEMTHLVVHQATMSGYGIVLPTWLNEGLALYAEGPLASSMASALSDAVSKEKKGTKTLDSVQSLASSFSADTNAAILAYAESYSLVDFLLNRKGGRDNMLGLLNAMKNGSGWKEALQSVYNLSVSELNSQWKQYVMGGGV